ncbi:MAG: methyltransferase domain-containing protein [Candidatus Pacebacteria bacterium]|nr:methyltransferase domain-containing protein [Candidatus Paceibacterota bacterium]
MSEEKTIKNNEISGSAVKDVYWGEFSEELLDKIIGCYQSGRFDDADDIIKSLDREDFIFGLGRSDFLFYLPLGKTSKVLDVGCGLGVHSFNAAKIAGEVYGCDLSKKRVDFCNLRKQREEVKNISFLHSDIENLPFESETFDAVILNGVVEWLGEKNKNKNPRDDQIEDLRRVKALLKPGGILYIGIENRIALSYLFKARDHNDLKYTTFMPRFAASFVSRLKRGKSYRTYTYSKKGYERLLKDVGFDKTPDFYIAHPGYNLPQFLIPFQDETALKFILNSMSIDKGTTGKVARLFTRIPFLRGIIRNFFYAYAIFVKK